MKMIGLSQQCLATSVRGAIAACAGAAALAFAIMPASITAASDDREGDTVTPIKHVIIVVGENRTFDHVFGTYKPAHGQSVWICSRKES